MRLWLIGGKVACMESEALGTWSGSNAEGVHAVADAQKEVGEG